MPKAKKKAVETAEPAPLTESIDEHKDETVSAAVNHNSQTPDLRLIDLDSLYKSNTNPRKRFPEASIEELATSIREKGILEPLIVRVKTDLSHKNPAFEIVCGERRYRAAMRAELKVAPCLVRELTDDEVLDIQIHENLHREDVHPMDEALGYKFLMEKLECGIGEIAARVGKSESYVASRLKLNQLIPEAQKDLEDGYITLTMGLELAKYAPDAQLIIYGEIYEDADWDYKLDRHVVTKDTEKGYLNLRTAAAIADYASRSVLHLLANAPFDTKAENLRSDGLACVNCPDRTGANALLFEGQINKKDSCLDPACYERKSDAHIQRLREKIAHEADIEPAEVPLVKTFSYASGASYLGLCDAIPLDGPRAKTQGSKKKCNKSVLGVDTYAGETYGTAVTVCLRSSKCEVHWGKTSNGSSSSGTSARATSAAPEERTAEQEKMLIAKRERREEIFDMRVAELVRWRVFRLAADKFASRVRIDGGGKDLLPRLVAKLWVNSNNGEASHTRGLVNSSMSEITDVPQGHFSLSHYDLEKVAKQAERLSDNNLKLTLFLLVHGDKGHTYFDSMTSQKTVRALADEYDLNFDLMDAQARVEIAGEKAKKYIDLYKAYLADVEAGKRSKIPRPWAPSYKPKDA